MARKVYGFDNEGYRQPILEKENKLEMKTQVDKWSDSYGSYTAYLQYFSIPEPGLYVLYYPDSSSSSINRFTFFSIHNLEKDHYPITSYNVTDGRYYKTRYNRDTKLSHIILVGKTEEKPNISCYQIIKY